MSRAACVAVLAAALLLAARSSQAAADDATRSEIEAVRAQLQALTERLNRLEAANQQLQAENERLREQAGGTNVLPAAPAPQPPPRQAAATPGESGKAGPGDWASRIELSGDFRFRGEEIAQQRVASAGDVGDAATDYRARIRARAALEARVTDDSTVVLQIATGGDDPRSANVTLGDDGTRKEIGLDLAYADWRYAQGGHLLLGKVKQPFWKPGQSLFYDSEYNPEGIATTFERGAFFGSAYGWWLEQNYSSSQAGYNEDTFMVGVQAGLRLPLAGGEASLAAHYYDLVGGQGSDPFYDGNAYGNTTVNGVLGGTATPVLAYDYNVVMLSGEVGGSFGRLPFAFWFDYAQNTAGGVDADTAWALGAMLGKVGAPGSWEVGVLYEALDKDALFAQMVDADFGAGYTDADGWVLRAGYAAAKNITLRTALYLNTRVVCGTGNSPGNQQCGSSIPRYDLDYDRLQLDVNYKF